MNLNSMILPQGAVHPELPVTLVICSELHVRPYPFLYAEIFARNIGGTATLIGDPPNILIGFSVGLTFYDFLFALGPVVVVVFVVQSTIVQSIGAAACGPMPAIGGVVANSASEMIKDPRLLKRSLAVIALVLAALVLARPLGLEAGAIALLSAPPS
jgi:Na+/H+ antiporter NhaD/arsenite permease-like protein